MKLDQEVVRIIQKNIENDVEVSLQSNLRNDLGVDSFGAIIIINALEDELSIEINDLDFKNINTVADIVESLRKKYPGLEGE